MGEGLREGRRSLVKREEHEGRRWSLVDWEEVGGGWSLKEAGGAWCS